ncbi:hypothetical protein JYU34_020339 [Plutella xylostella]|uniref:Trichohyalin-plectin-homology domain-containing protein n=1 Tax=Plutella xylostella TaxID=51655 RepID=A0ABQ7PU95_PLUXY|nr:hypothetical protein JYU34_020339 [Plutella xylostella]
MCDPTFKRQKTPLEGFGVKPGEIYYTSRTNRATAHYNQYIAKLRASEEEERRGDDLNKTEERDQQQSNFFIRCDRKSLIKKVAQRVDLAMASYQDDLDKKRARLSDLLTKEEEENIRKFVVQVQSGAELAWKEKEDRLAYLLAKRQKEHEEKYKDTPLTKCTHLTPLLVKQRAIETQEIQLYQMREKEARREAEREFDMMWHELTMKESEALAARLEHDAIERKRQDYACALHSEQQKRERERQREIERERLIEETKWLRSVWDKENMEQEQAEQQRELNRIEAAQEQKQTNEENAALRAKQKLEQDLINQTWDALSSQGKADDTAKLELMKIKEKELVECNRRMTQLKKDLLLLEQASDKVTESDAATLRQIEQRCKYQRWANELHKDCRKTILEQIKEKCEAKQRLKKKLDEENEYFKQLSRQLDELTDYKRKSNNANKIHQGHLVEQIKYNQLLKLRAKQEELSQVEKCKMATKEYEAEIQRMLKRPFYSEHVHPFVRPMLQAKTTDCPCGKPDWCK